jgi:hypothetical protein
MTSAPTTSIVAIKMIFSRFDKTIAISRLGI